MLIPLKDALISTLASISTHKLSSFKRLEVLSFSQDVAWSDKLTMNWNICTLRTAVRFVQRVSLLVDADWVSTKHWSLCSVPGIKVEDHMASLPDKCSPGKGTHSTHEGKKWNIMGVQLGTDQMKKTEPPKSRLQGQGMPQRDSWKSPVWSREGCHSQILVKEESWESGELQEKLWGGNNERWGWPRGLDALEIIPEELVSHLHSSQRHNKGLSLGLWLQFHF